MTRICLTLFSGAGILSAKRYLAIKFMEDLTSVILSILALLIAGIPVGFILRRHKKVLKVADKIVSLSVYVLLFILGAGLGANESLMAQLSEMSFAAVVITFGAFVGSALAAGLTSKLFFKEKPVSTGGGERS